MLSLRLVFLITAITGLAIIIFDRLSAAGVFTHVDEFNVGQCQTIATVPGCEDIQVDLSQDLLYLAVNNWTTFFQGSPEGKGAIYTLDLTTKDAQLHHASIDQPTDFTPHGIHLYEDPQTGEKSLFVINHKKDGHYIEIFDVVEKGILKHRETLTDALLVSPNEIFATGKRSFYVSNDIKRQLNKWYVPIVIALGMEEGSLVYYDGVNWKFVAENIHLANGIASSPDGKTLYLGETSKKRIRVYEGDVKTGQLKFKTAYGLNSGPDNFNVDAEGNIWIAGLPNLLATSRSHRDNTVKAPVEVLKAKFEGEKLANLERALSSGGSAVSAISAVSFYKGKAIMSGVFETAITMCNLTEDGSQVRVSKNIDL